MCPLTPLLLLRTDRLPMLGTFVSPLVSPTNMSVMCTSSTRTSRYAGQLVQTRSLKKFPRSRRVRLCFWTDCQSNRIFKQKQHRTPSRHRRRLRKRLRRRPQMSVVRPYATGRVQSHFTRIGCHGPVFDVRRWPVE